MSADFFKNVSLIKGNVKWKSVFFFNSLDGGGVALNSRFLFEMAAQGEGPEETKIVKERV